MLGKKYFPLTIRGQSTLEYVLLMAIVAGIMTLLLQQAGPLIGRLEAPIQKEFKYIYKYGDPEACGYDDEAPCSGPKRHPKIGAVRIFGRK